MATLSNGQTPAIASDATTGNCVPYLPCPYHCPSANASAYGRDDKPMLSQDGTCHSDPNPGLTFSGESIMVNNTLPPTTVSNNCFMDIRRYKEISGGFAVVHPVQLNHLRV